MNRLPIIALLLAACVDPAAPDTTTEECLCMSPLDEFGNSVRRFGNDDGSEVVASPKLLLGPGLVASRPNGAPGETTFATLSAPSIATQAAELAAITERLAKLEALPTILATYVAPGGYTTTTATAGSVLPVDLIALGGDEGVVVEIPDAAPANAGQEIQIFETSYQSLGTTFANVRFAVKVPVGQTIVGLPIQTFSGGTLPVELDGIDVVFFGGINPSIVLKSLGDRWLVRARSF